MFSLIMPTLGRSQTIERFLESLLDQNCDEFEVIIIDQNVDDRLVDIISRYQSQFTIQHIRFNGRGAARARNVGLSYASGEYISFPDDDCWYRPGLLALVKGYFLSDLGFSGFTGRYSNGEGETEGGGGLNGGWPNTRTKLNKYNAWFNAIEFTMFFRRTTFMEFGGFNSEIGIGAGTPWGAGEGTELLLRMLDRDINIEYRPEIHMHHPVKASSFDDGALARQISYEQGIGYVIRISNYPFWYFPMRTARTLASAVVALLMFDKRKSRFKYMSMVARIQGWRGINIQSN
jgi:glycosyltransferase involved in cell wall biosynthesis